MFTLQKCLQKCTQFSTAEEFKELIIENGWKLINGIKLKSFGRLRDRKFEVINVNGKCWHFYKNNSN